MRLLVALGETELAGLPDRSEHKQSAHNLRKPVSRGGPYSPEGAAHPVAKNLGANQKLEHAGHVTTT